MSEDKDKAPERVWITWDDAYPWPTPDMGGDAYIRADAVLGIIDKASEEWATQARDRKSKTYSAYALAALDLRGRMVEALERAADSREGEDDG